MADTKLTGLTEQTVLASDDWLYSVDKSDTTDDAAGSSRKLATSTLLKWSGGLTPTAYSTDADITGAVGNLYTVTMSSFTVNRNLTLPSATAGERLGVYIVDGHATLALILIGAASQTINGGSAATEWSRVFIKGECVVFLCVAANTWIVESDRRIAQIGQIKRTTTQGSLSGDTVVQLNTSVIDVGNVVSTSNYRIIVRRAGNYRCSGQVSQQQTSTSAIQRMIINLAKNGSLNHRGGRFVNFVDAVAHYLTAEIYWMQTLAAGDYVQLMVNSNIGATPTIDAQANIEPFLSVEEQF